MITQLDFYIEELLNSKLLIVQDCSWYNPEILVTNGKLDIKFPGSDLFFTVSVGKDFKYVINSNTLNITNVLDFKSLKDLPDGIWTIKYSICPNEELFVEYTFLRNTKQLIKWQNLYCNLKLEKCNKKDYEKELQNIRKIKDLIDAAKYLADCGKYEKAMELYNEANYLLDKQENNCNCA